MNVGADSGDQLNSVPIPRIIDNYFQGGLLAGPPRIDHVDYPHIFFNPLELQSRNWDIAGYSMHLDYDLRRRDHQFSRRFPEELIIDFDWRFSNYTINLIGNLINSRDRVLYLGTPMPFFHVGRSMGRWGTLVDRNNLYKEYIPDASFIKSVSIDQFFSVSAGDEKYDAVVADPPWSMSEILKWSTLAAAILSENGILITSLFPPNTRPTASKEINHIIDNLGKIFSSISHYIIDYNTPSYEAEILKSKGMPHLDNWRRGFLIVLSRKRSGNAEILSSVGHSASIEWLRSTTGEKTSAVRRDIDEQALQIQFLDSVSSRDPRWPHIKLIDSRNLAGIDVF